LRCCSAFNDLINPLAEEFDKINIEISILSVPELINSYEEIKLGIHGLVLEEDPFRALLLPQVATKHNFTLEQFLSSLCEKARLSPDYYLRRKLKIKVFTASIFSENEFKNRISKSDEFPGKKYRKPAVAGMFYPSDPGKLQNEIETLLSISIPDRKVENIFGLVSPHAGYIYSGRTAAYGYNLIKGKNYKTVIIISPSHREYFPGISIYDGDGFETPLGKVDLDNEMADKLINQSRIIFRGIEGHRQEHAVEVQIPFLQQVLSEFKIVPVVMGDQGKMFVDELSQKISESADDSTLIVASSDLYHYTHVLKQIKWISWLQKELNNLILRNWKRILI
jgi:AmmeMemoRadiSam system protein B